MINLIGNEIKKVFSKLSIKVLIIIAIILMLVQAVVQTFFFDEDNYYDYYAESINSEAEYYENLLQDLNSETQITQYVDAKTQLDILKLKQQYIVEKDKNDESWESEYIDTIGYQYIYALNNSKYNQTYNLAQAEKDYNNFVKVLEDNNWKVYVNSKIEKAKEELEFQKQLLEEATTEFDIEELEKQVAITELNVEVYELRLDKNIEYDNSYMDKALKKYYYGMEYVLNNEGNITSEEESQSIYQTKSEALIAKHSIDTGKDLYDENNAAAAYQDYIINMGEFILILTIIIVAGSIVSEEFNKGTIKQLLTRPYGRAKVWLSKYLASIIITIIVAIIVGIIGAVIFGLFMGFDDFSIYNIGVYDYNSGSAYTMNVFAYVGMVFISKVPLLIMLGTIAIFVSTIFNNTALAVAVPLLGMIAAELVSVVLMYYEKFRFLKYFITPHWDWSIYNFGKKSMFSFIDFEFSIKIYIVWLIALVGLAILRFKKEDIKNI